MFYTLVQFSNAISYNVTRYILVLGVLMVGNN